MSCLETTGRIVSEFARLILFVASIIFLLSSLLLLAFTYQSRRDFSYAKVENVNTGLTVLVALSIYLVVLAVLGIFASFYSSKSTIKLLACMLTLNVIVGITVLVTSGPKFNDAHVELESKFKEYLPEYDWAHRKDASYAIKNATEAWDNLQWDSHCCGLASPDDWNKYRPKGLKENFLPISCCPKSDTDSTPIYGDDNDDSTPQNCDKNKGNYWKEGCTKEMQGAFVAIIYMVISLVAFSLVLGVIAAIVIICRPSEANLSDY